MALALLPGNRDTDSVIISSTDELAADERHPAVRADDVVDPDSTTTLRAGQLLVVGQGFL
ncbi:MAG: hypothetical protein M3173_07725 [Chloroflexota bacterium]|nr:hypothetical protein [Chloroflexota bacterium]